MSQHQVTLLLGSNLGNQKENIENAIFLLQREVGNIIVQSNFLFSHPVEFVSNNIFCNIAIIIKTQFSPIKLLNLIKRIEFDLGRENDSSIANKYLDRIIDIDIVLYEGITFSSERLTIPHTKHLHKREFSRELLNNIEKH